MLAYCLKGVLNMTKKKGASGLPGKSVPKKASIKKDGGTQKKNSSGGSATHSIPAKPSTSSGGPRKK